MGPAVFAALAGGAAAGATNAVLNGGDLRANLFFGAALGGLSAGLGPPLAAALGGGPTGAVGSAALLGAAFGGIGAGIAGKNILAGMLGGALSGAVLAMAIHSYQAWQQQGSPAVAEASGAGGEARSGRFSVGAPIGGADPRSGPLEAFAELYSSNYGESTAGVGFFDGTCPSGIACANFGDTIVLDEGYWSSPSEAKIMILGEEFRHITQQRTFSNWGEVYADANYRGAFQNVFEYDAYLRGKDFLLRLRGVVWASPEREHLMPW